MQRPFIVCRPEKCTGCQLCELACSARHGGYNPLLSHIRLVRNQPASIMVYACPRECISVSEATGIMLVDKDVCNGCGWCVEACEFGAVTINHAERVVAMCTLCEDRDSRPRCVEICVYGALSLSTPAAVAERRRREIVLSGVLPEMRSTNEGMRQSAGDGRI